MTNIQAFIIGLVQGLTEFLPVSSSGHLTLLQKLFGIQEAPLLLDIMMHFGTLLAVIIVYLPRIKEMICHPLASELKWLVVATIPAVVATLLFEDKILALFSGDYLALSFLLTSFVLVLGDAIGHLRLKHRKHVRWYDAVCIGCAQVVAIAPGLSRSGCTISAGMICGLSGKRAADFSFLMSVPAILGSVVFGMKDILEAVGQPGLSFGTEFQTMIAQLGGAMPLLIGIGTAFISGLLAIKLMRSLIRQIGLRWFALYTFLLSAFLFIKQVFSL